MLSIIFLYSPAWLFLILPLAALFSFWAYRGKGVYSPRQALLLALLRFSLLSGLGFLLLQPQWQVEEFRTEKPLLLWLEDRSESMRATEDSAEIRRFWEEEAPAVRRELEALYRVRHFVFAADLTGPADSFFAQASDIAKALNQSQGLFFRQPVEASLLISDGIHNQGLVPSVPARQSPYPIYTLLFGDSSQARDAAIVRVDYNQSVVRGRRFRIELGLKATGLGGQKAKLSLRNEKGQRLGERNIVIESKDFYQAQDFLIDADSVGLFQYHLEWDLLPGDERRANNQRSFSIEVIDYKHRIALLAAAPHPDLGALKASLASDASFSTRLYSDGSLPDSLPDLYVLHNPSPAQSEAVLASGRPFLLIAGAEHQWNQWSEAWPGASSISGESEMSFSAPAPDFVRFQWWNKQDRGMSKWPPVRGIYGPLPDIRQDRVILYKSLGKLPTSIPLFFTGADPARRSAFFLGEDIWRWRLFDYKENHSFRQFDKLWLKTVEYLLAGNSERERLQIQVEPRYSQFIPVDFRARLLDPNGEYSSRGKLDLELIPAQGPSRVYSLSPDDGGYRRLIKGLKPGQYRYVLKAQLGEERFVRKGQWIVEANSLEKQDLTAKAPLMAEISRLSGGRFFPWSARQDLWEELKEKELSLQQYRSVNKQPFLSFWPIYFVFLTLAALEWLLRKYWGGL